MSKQCKFCDSLNFSFQLDVGAYGIEHEYTVALVSHAIRYQDGKMQRRGRVTDYRYKGLGYKLKYCPECGRKIRYAVEKRKIKKEQEERKREKETETKKE